MDIKAVIFAILGVIVALVLVTGVLVPQTNAPTVRATLTSLNSTAFAALDGIAHNRTFAVTYPYSASTGTMTITFATNSTFTGTQLLTKAGVAIANFTNTTTTSAYVTISNANFDTATATHTYGFSNGANATQEVNITGMTLTYTQQSQQEYQGWSTTQIVIFAIVGIIMVLSLIGFVVKFLL